MFADYLILASLILGMNIFPILMPPTWTVLAFFSVKYNLPLIPIVLIGASCAAFGRIILATISRLFFRRFLSKKSQDNYTSLGQYFNSHKKISIPLVITYMFFPIPSNDIFIAAGLAKANIKILSAAFFAGRLMSYTFWVSASKHFSENIEDIFNAHFNKTNTFLFELGGLLILYIIGKIAWKKILKNTKK